MGVELQGQLDEAALEALYRRLERPLYNVVYRRLWSAAEAQDVVQETFMRLWGMRRRVRLGSVEPLLYRIALNLAAKQRRSRRVWRWLGLESLPGLSAGSNPEREIEEGQHRSAVRDAVEALPERLREVLLLTELTSLTYEEVGQAIGIPAGTVGSRRHAALEALRRTIGKESTA